MSTTNTSGTTTGASSTGTESGGSAKAALRKKRNNSKKNSKNKTTKGRNHRSTLHNRKEVFYSNMQSKITRIKQLNCVISLRSFQYLPQYTLFGHLPSGIWKE
jgi:hypothetical protein